MHNIKCESCGKVMPTYPSKDLEQWHITVDGVWLCDACFEELKIEAIVDRLGIFKRLDALERKAGIK